MIPGARPQGTSTDRPLYGRVECAPPTTAAVIVRPYKIDFATHGLDHHHNQISDCAQRNLAAADRTNGETSSSAFFAEVFAKSAATHP